MVIKSYTKAQLRAIYGNISRETLNTWLKPIESMLPHYNKNCKVLTPAQRKVIFEELGTSDERDEDRTIAGKRS